MVVHGFSQLDELTSHVSDQKGFAGALIGAMKLQTNAGVPVLGPVVQIVVGNVPRLSISEPVVLAIAPVASRYLRQQ
jgi:hypothetical protein